MATPAVKLGQTIETKDGRQGVVRYIGNLHIAEGEWLGLELSDASGKNDGSVKGERYFTCQHGYGIFVRKESVVKIVRQATPSLNTAPVKANGSATAPNGAGRVRPTNGVTPELARKRQSLMSAGPAATAGARLSLRSPTRSPTKSQSTTNTSAASTPRTGTPATTARTSDSSTKSRLSLSSKTSSAPTVATTRPSSLTSRPSLGGAAPKPARPPSLTSRTPLSGKRLSAQSKPPSRPEPHESEPRLESGNEVEAEAQGKSPTIDEEDEIETPNIDSIVDETSDDRKSSDLPDSKRTASIGRYDPRAPRKTSISKHNGASTVESRTAQVRELEQLKVKVRSLENQREEDREQLQLYETMKSDNERFKNIIQALQTKLKTSQHDLSDLRTKIQIVEDEKSTVPERSAEHESEMELATLDKEMAEERAESFQMELEALKAKHEELELEVEILREENRELGSVMSPEEKASAGWLQMERERDRLREALIKLRDLTQETESNLKAEVKELQEHLEEVESTASMYVETAEKLTRLEETNRHLIEQLEAVESNDEIVEAMEVQREQHVSSIEQLRKQIQDLEEHIQVTDELENFHIEEEKRLHASIDEAEALLSESYRQNVDQDRVIEDLEYTLSKFRDVVQGLQNDIDELRRSRDISEMEANEMSSKSKAMMDLNLRLQNNTAKSQAKIIDAELDKVDAQIGKSHIEILNMFTLDSFDTEKPQVLAFLKFGRLKAKANLAGKLLGDRLRERPHLSHAEEIFNGFELVECFQWIAGVSQRFEKFMSACSTNEFAACAGALYELEPVERSVSSWLDALRRDEIGTDGTDHMQRMKGVLTDLAEKLLPENGETKATHIFVQIQMVENLMESLAGQTNALVKLVQTKLGGPKEEDDESLLFDKKMDQLGTKIRTVKYQSSKVVQQLAELRANSMGLGETAWVLFEDAEQFAQSLLRQFRETSTTVVDELSKFEPDVLPTYPIIIDHMTNALRSARQSEDAVSNMESSADVFGLFMTRLNKLQVVVDDLSVKASDVNSANEFEPTSAPWVVRSKELRAQKVIAPEIQDEITRLERRNGELGSRIVEREKAIEEMSMRVELAEKRLKESRARDDKDKAHQDELERLRDELDQNAQMITDLKSQIEAQTQLSSEDRIELESLRKAASGEAIPVPGTPGIVDDRVVREIQLEANLLHAEIAALQAAVRFLREENHNLRIPITETLIKAAKDTWLDSLYPATKANAEISAEGRRKQRLEREAQDIYSNLIDVASSLKPVRLTTKKHTATKPPSNTNDKAISNSKTTTIWQPRSETTRYAVLRQREDIEKWNAWRDDFIKRAKTTESKLRLKSRLERTGSGGIARTAPTLPQADGSNLTSVSPIALRPTDLIGKSVNAEAGVTSQGSEGVRIIES